MKQIKGIWFPDSDTHFETAIDGDGNYQKEQFQAVLKYIKPEDRGLFIDVGAHVGLWSRMAMRNGFRKFICFEPDPENFECLLENFEIVKRKNRLLYEFALSDEVKMYDMKDEKSDNSGAKILEEVEFSEEATQIFDVLACLSPSEYRMNTFEGIDFESLKGKILIKIDVQGYEAKVVRGMTNFIKEYKPIIIVEQMYNQKQDLEATEYLQSLGMKVLETIHKEVILGYDK